MIVGIPLRMDSERPDPVSRLKGSGYLVSTASVVLLGIPAIKSAIENEALLLAVVAGMLLSILGMALRWRSHRLERKQKDKRSVENDSH